MGRSTEIPTAARLSITYGAVMADLPKRPLKLWVVVVVSCAQALYVVDFGAGLYSTAIQTSRFGGVDPVGTAIGLLLIVISVAEFPCGILMIFGFGWARHPVAIVQYVVIVGMLALVAIYGLGAALYGVVYALIPVLVLIGLFSAEVRGWFAQVAKLRVAARLEP